MHNPVVLHESQSKAISFGTGPMLVIAGPGSGKTLVITHRILNLIKSYKVNPDNILVITFTKAAALEMQSRFFALAGTFYPVSFGTCHAIFFQIIRRVKDIQTKDILKEQEKCSILEDILTDPNKPASFSLDPSIELEQKLLSEISKIKNMGINPETFESLYCDKEEFQYVYESYQRICKRLRKIDFDDMLILCLELLKSRPELLKACQENYRYILVDEFQDINTVQYEIIKLLAGKEKNVFAVGDDDQSIYGFRGATPNIMQKFMEDYKEANRLALKVNYRSKKEIVDTSVRLINHNSNRFIKNFDAKPNVGHCVKYIAANNRREQYEKVASCIQEYMKVSSHHYEDVAVLFRTNGHASMLIEQLTLLGIPFQCKERLDNIYASSIAKDLISYIRFALHPELVSDFYRIMNRPSRYIKRKEVPTRDFSKEILLKNIKDQNVIQKVLQLYKQLDFIRKLEPFPAINYIRKGIGYEKFVVDQAKHFHLNVQDELDVLEEITQSSKNFSSLEHWLEFVTTYEETMDKGYKNQIGIHIKTMHGAKGLEWPLVILPDLNEGNVPYKKAQTSEQIEEERRIFYVAMTRAQEYLFFFFVKKEQADHQGLPSRFLYECLKH